MNAAVIAEIAAKRAGQFGRAPVMRDVDVAVRLLDYEGSVDDAFVEVRRLLVHGAGHDYYRRRTIVDSVPDQLLRMDPDDLGARVDEWRHATRARLFPELGRQPTEIELAEQLTITVPELEKMMLDANAVGLISLNKKWYETDSYKDVREIDILEDKKGEDPTRRIQKTDLMRLVTKGLNRNERLIIILYYYEELTMKEIGATLDLSESRVSQMHSSIVQRLQSQLERRRPEFGT